MFRKVFRSGNSLVISLPREVLHYLDIQEGAEVELNIDRDNRQVILKPAEKPLVVSSVDEIFANQLADFIERYRPALEQLSRKRA